MSGTILDVIDAGSFWLLQVNAGDRIVEQVIEPRYMQDIVANERLESSAELVGRGIEISEDGMAVGFR
jgi:hypothetical protein